jgi:hypothetical protein
VEATAPVTVEQAAAILGVSPSTVHRRIRSDALKSEQAERPQGKVWLIHLPPGTTVASADLPQPTGAEATAPTGGISTTPAAEAMVSLIQTTIGTVLAPLVAELGSCRQTIERQADELKELARERGRFAAEARYADLEARTAIPAHSPPEWRQRRWVPVLVFGSRSRAAGVRFVAGGEVKWPAVQRILLVLIGFALGFVVALVVLWAWLR